jgi:anti-sigma factor RsiW
VSSAAPDEMTCRELMEVITDYIEGTLPERDRRRLEQHLGDCPYCVNYLAQMRETIQALSELPEESIPPQAREELLETFRAWRAAR